MGSGFQKSGVVGIHYWVAVEVIFDRYVVTFPFVLFGKATVVAHQTYWLGRLAFDR